MEKPCINNNHSQNIPESTESYIDDNDNNATFSAILVNFENIKIIIGINNSY